MFDTTYVLLFDVLGAAIAVVSLVLVRIPRPPKKADAPPPQFPRDEGGGSAPVSPWLFVFVLLVTFFIFPLSALFPLMTTKHFAGEPPR